MIYRKGNLITAAQRGNIDVIAHSCNCFCNMGRGIAPQIAKAFPSAKTADDSTIRGNKEKLGTFSKTDIEGSHALLTVYNLYGQYGWKPEQVTYGTDYPSLFRALRNMRDDLSLSDQSLTLGLPRIGAGLGGGDWKLISQMIEETFRGTNVFPIIYELDYKECQ